MSRVNDIQRFAFIVGAPRCGTTSLANYLKGHPDVCFPIVKEPHYFAQNDLTGLTPTELRREVEQSYLARFFPHCSDRARVAVDGSVSYLYTPEQLEPVLRLWPDSRFIITLRNPLEMLPSLHKRLVFLGDESLTSFEDAWAAVPDRASGKRIPRSCVDPRWLRYDQAGRYATYLERLFETVGRDHCLVLLFDDLAANPRAQYRRMMEFLDLPSKEHAIDFTPRRRSHDVRSAWLQRLLKRPPKRVRKYLAGPHFRKRERKLAGDLADSGAVDAVFAFRKRLLKWNRVEPREHSLPVAVQSEIRAALKGEMERLEQLIGRDLGHWLQVRADSSAAKRAATSVRIRPSFSAAE